MLTNEELIQKWKTDVIRLRILKRWLSNACDGCVPEDHVDFAWGALGQLYENLVRAPRDFLIELESLTGQRFEELCEDLTCEFTSGAWAMSDEERAEHLLMLRSRMRNDERAAQS